MSKIIVRGVLVFTLAVIFGLGSISGYGYTAPRGGPQSNIAYELKRFNDLKCVGRVTPWAFGIVGPRAAVKKSMIAIVESGVCKDAVEFVERYKPGRLTNLR